MIEDVKKKLQAKHTEELADAKAYDDLAKEAMEAGHHHVCGILTDIANEEKSHAEVIEHILNYHEK